MNAAVEILGLRGEGGGSIEGASALGSQADTAERREEAATEAVAKSHGADLNRSIEILATVKGPPAVSRGGRSGVPQPRLLNTIPSVTWITLRCGRAAVCFPSPGLTPYYT